MRIAIQDDRFSIHIKHTSAQSFWLQLNQPAPARPRSCIRLRLATRPCPHAAARTHFKTKAKRVGGYTLCSTHRLPWIGCAAFMRMTADSSAATAHPVPPATPRM